VRGAYIQDVDEEERYQYFVVVFLLVNLKDFPERLGIVHVPR
jgi:hypothetical protein